MKRKKNIIICLLAALITLSATSVFNVAFAGSANTDLTAQIINKNNLVTYLHLNNITDIFADAGGIYIADENGAHFKENGKQSGVSLNATASQIEKAANKILFLNSTGVCLENAAQPLIEGEFFSFAALNNSVYLITKAKDKIVKYDIAVNNETSVVTAEKSLNEWSLGDIPGNVAEICATSSSVVFYSEYSNGNMFYFLSEKNKNELRQITLDDEIRCIAGNKNNDSLAVLTSSSIYIYPDVAERKGTPRIVPFSGGRKISLNNTEIFASTLRSNIDLIDYSAAEVKTSSFIAARSSADWFYSEPNAISVRNEKIFVADTRNNRVVTLDKNGFTVASTALISPVSVAATRGGELIAAHNTNELINMSTGKTLEVGEKSAIPDIKKMVIDVDDNVYALIETEDGSYLIRTDSQLSSPEILDYNNPTGLSLKSSGQACVYSDGKIRFLDGSKSFTAPLLTDFYLDYADNVFGINTNNQLIAIKDGVETVFNVTSPSGSTLNFDNIAISSVAIGALTVLNDILLLDSTTHSLWKVSGEAVGVVDVSDYFTFDESEVAGTKTHKADKNLLARVKKNAYLYSRPAESEIICAVTQGQTLFIRLDIEAPENMYFAVTENVVADGGVIQSGTIKYGYIFRQYVDYGAYTYEVQANTYAKALTPSVVVYKYPSSYAPVVSTLGTGNVVTLLTFAPDYLDADSKEWTRISLSDNAEGFVRSHLLSTSLFSNTSQLQANATVSADTLSYVYDSVNKTYSPFKSVAKGTRIEVETPFDRSKTYTKVLFYIDNELIDIDCYILTSEIEYDGLDVIQIVAVGVIVFTLILAVVLTITLSRRNKRRRIEE